MRPVVFDSSFLVAAVEPAVVPVESHGGLEEDYRARLNQFLLQLDREKARIIVPTPVLAEIFVKKPERMGAFLRNLRRSSRFSIGEFGTAAAAAAADLMRRHWPNPRARQAEWSRHRLKFDLQILAIAQVANAACIYTNDKELADLARAERMSAMRFQDLPTLEADQGSLPLPAPPPSVEADDTTPPPPPRD
jgi:predicted nucleic acid-binding protein